MAAMQHQSGKEARLGTAGAAVAALALAFAEPAFGQRPVEETISVARIDGSEIKVEIVRPQTGGRVPLVLVVEGSCAEGEAGAGAKALDPRNNPGRPFARLMVAKTESCSADVAGQRVLDH